jgi:hypothetical protein
MTTTNISNRRILYIPALASGGTPYAAGPGDSQTFILWGSVAYGYSAAKAALGTTKAFRIVDGSNANGQDILVLPSGLTDVATLNTWIGSFGAAHVTTLYDQVGTNNWTQTTVSQMPTITISGINGLPSMTFASASTQILVSGNVTQSQPFTFEAVTERTLNFTLGQNVIATSTPVQLGFQNVANEVFSYSGVIALVDTSVNDSAAHVVQAAYNGASSTLNVDGRTQVSGNADPNAPTAVPLGIGGVPPATSTHDGYISEAGMYAATYNSGVQSNARTRYGL